MPVKNLFRTTDDFTLTILRVMLGCVMLAHGSQKMLGWFGGHGPAETVEMWTKWFGFPAFITWLVIIGEFFGPILLIAGLLTRVMSAVTALIMFGAIYFVHLRWGFYMNWYSESDRGEGIEYHILVLAICAVLMIKGAGKLSVDKVLAGRQ